MDFDNIVLVLRFNHCSLLSVNYKFFALLGTESYNNSHWCYFAVSHERYRMNRTELGRLASLEKP